MREAQHAGRRRQAEKPFPLYPLTLEEVADRMLATPPSPHHKTPHKTPAAPKKRATHKAKL